MHIVRDSIWGNKSRSIDDPIIRKQVITIVTRLIKKC
jgi:hypothetical protein